MLFYAFILCEARILALPYCVVGYQKALLMDACSICIFLVIFLLLYID